MCTYFLARQFSMKLGVLYNRCPMFSVILQFLPSHLLGWCVDKDENLTRTYTQYGYSNKHTQTSIG